jgi:hypothetical protein
MREQRGINANTFKRRASLPPEETTYFASRSRYTAPAAHAYVDIDEEGGEVYTRPPSRTSARRYDLTPIRHGRGERRTDELPRQGKHPMFYVGICLVIVVVFLTAYTLIPPALQKWSDDRAYGYPRTFQTDANVGHGGVEHFLALNNHGTIEVLEIPTNPSPLSQPRLYIIVRLSSLGADLVPATLSFPDVNGDGRPDIQVTVLDGSNPSVWILFNNGTTFVPKL